MSALPHAAAVALGAAGQLVVLGGPLALIEDRAPSDAAAWTLLALATAWCAAEGFVAGPAARRPGRAEAGRWLPAAAGLSLLATLWLALFFRDAGTPAGAVLFAAGVALRLWSMRTLGVWFVSEVRLLPGHRLVTSGPYRVLRHPSELGLLLAAAGAVALCGAWPALVPLAALSVLVAMRVRAEDRLLAAAFPAPFDAWRRRVPGLLPFSGSRAWAGRASPSAPRRAPAPPSWR